MIEIKSTNPLFRKKKFLKNAARIALDSESLSENSSDISILITDDASVQVLNKIYRGIDNPTDVLSFSADEVDPDNGLHYLGDIAISYDRAFDQSITAGHSVETELSLLVIHGVLHLLGYDHTTDQEKKLMWKKQYMILNQLGIKMERFSGDS